MKLQLFINQKLVCEQIYTNKARKAAIEALKKRFWYSIKFQEWAIYEVRESKMNDPDFRVDENQIDKITYYKKAS